MVKLRGAGLTDRGKNPDRPGNEDAFAVDEAHGLFVVCDGMGGHAAGEVASRMAVDCVIDAVRAESLTDPIGVLVAAVQHADLVISIEARFKPETQGMGTTIVALIQSGDKIGVVHVGDSRCYRLREGALTRLTRDHSFLEEALPGEDDLQFRFANRPYAHTITQSVGLGKSLKPGVYREVSQVGDVYLLCTDGLASPSREVSDEQIRDILVANPDPADAAKALIQAALDAGGHDNVTAVVVTVTE